MKSNRSFNRRNRLLSHLRLATAVTLIAAAVVSAVLALLMSATMTTSVSAAPLQSDESVTQHIALSGTSSPQSGGYTASGDGDVTEAEFPGQIDEADGSPGPYPGIIVNRSLSTGVGKGVSVNSGKKAKSNPQFNT